MSVLTFDHNKEKLLLKMLLWHFFLAVQPTLDEFELHVAPGLKCVWHPWSRLQTRPGLHKASGPHVALQLWSIGPRCLWRILHRMKITVDIYLITSKMINFLEAIVLQFYCHSGSNWYLVKGSASRRKVWFVVWPDNLEVTSSRDGCFELHHKVALCSFSSKVCESYKLVV